MGQITELISMLGSHMEIVVIGCAEIAAAVALISTGIARKFRKEKKPDTRSAEQLFLYEIGRSQDEGYMVVRHKDMMPVYGTGDLEGLLGVSLLQVQDDITSIRSKMKNDAAVKRFWKSYRSWDREKPLYAEIQMKDGQWIRVAVYGCKDGRHDLISFVRTTGMHKQIEAYEKELEQRIAGLLDRVEGVGKADVMVVLKSSEERVFHVDKNSRTSATEEKGEDGRIVREQELSESTVMGGGNQGPVVEKELTPEVAGIVISADGGGNASVRAEISEAMEALFGLPAHKIKVLKRVE